jgi:hypothetical protein
MRTLCTT